MSAERETEGEAREAREGRIWIVFAHRTARARQRPFTLREADHHPCLFACLLACLLGMYLVCAYRCRQRDGQTNWVDVGRRRRRRGAARPGQVGGEADIRFGAREEGRATNDREVTSESESECLSVTQHHSPSQPIFRGPMGKRVSKRKGGMFILGIGQEITRAAGLTRLEMCELST